MTVSNLIHELSKRKADPTLVALLKQVSDNEEIFTAKEAQAYLKVSREIWKQFIRDGWAVPFYRPHSKRPVFKRSQIDTLLALSPWDAEEEFTEKAKGCNP